MKEEHTSRNLLYNNRFGLKVNFLLAFSSTIKTSHDWSVSFWTLLALQQSKNSFIQGANHCPGPERWHSCSKEKYFKIF